MKKSLICLLLTFGLVPAAFAVEIPKDEVVDILASIPFVRGADLCRFKDAYTQTRTEHINQMVDNAERLMYAGTSGRGAIEMLHTFEEMYERTLNLAVRNLDRSLEASLFSFVDGYYRQFNPKVKKLNFINLEELSVGSDQESYDKLDYLAYGTYTLAPNCEGNIQVTLHLIGKNKRLESFMAIGKPAVVMSKIASELFTRIQRTKFPSKIRIPNGKFLTLVGTMNDSIDSATTHRQAENICKTLDARLPTFDELELVDGYGDWSGGVNTGYEEWLLQHNQVYMGHWRNPGPVNASQLERQQGRRFKYYCVK